MLMVRNGKRVDDSETSRSLVSCGAATQVEGVLQVPVL